MRSSSILFGAVALVLLTSCGPKTDAPATPSVPPTETAAVTPRFGWSAGTELPFVQSRRLREGLEGRETEKTNSGSMVMRVAEVEDGLGVSMSEFDPDAPPEVEAALKQALPRVLLELRVDRDGRFVRAIGVEQTLAAITKMVKDASPATAEFLASFDAAFLESYTRREWDWMVGYWNGRTLNVGDDANVELTLGGDRSPVMATLSAAPAPCEPGGTDARCVRLTMKASRTGEDCRDDAFARMFLLGLLQADQSAELRFEGCSIEVETVSEPDTLRPHRQRQVQRLALTMTIDGQRLPKFSTEREVTRTFESRYTSMVGSGSATVNAQPVFSRTSSTVTPGAISTS